MRFFEAAILNYFFQKKKLRNFKSYEVSFFPTLWMVSPESWKRGCPN